jgi:hypothetical protein
VRLHRERFEEGVQLLRKMNDDFATSIFAVADTMVDSFDGASRPQAEPTTDKGRMTN